MLAQIYRKFYLNVITMCMAPTYVYDFLFAVRFTQPPDHKNIVTEFYILHMADS